MIAATVFGLHLIAAVYAFIRGRKDGGTKEGWIAVAFFILIFSVGWTLSSFILSQLLPPEGFARWISEPLSPNMQVEVNRNTFSLVVLTIGEAIFYYLYLKPQKVSEGGTET